MKQTSIFLLLAAATTLPSVCLADNAADIDTVKVIDTPRQVVVTQNGDEVLLQIDGSATDPDYRYEYLVKPKRHGRLATASREGSEVEFHHPFSKCDSAGERHHFEVFLSDVYFGFGGHSIDAANRDAVNKSTSQVGVLNFVGLAYRFNQSRSRVSLGVGFDWSHYGMRNPYFWHRADNGVVGWEKGAADYNKHHALLSVYSLQFPLMYRHSLGKRWGLSAGVVMNWHCYASFTNSHRMGMSDYNVTTHGLQQRKLSFDCVAMVTWHGIGAYFRYSPQSVFKAGFGPEMKNRWTLGFVLGGW